MSVFEKLLAVQCELKAPKSQYNAFGKYKYRNCEDILEAAKPLLGKHKALVFLSDDIVVKGDRYYVEATATFVDVETSETIQVTSYAREEDSKKGMDGSQVTGASSSYARKYALNGLFDIDDTKDSDSTNNGQNNDENGSKKASKSTNKQKPTNNPNGNQNGNSGLSEKTRNAINSALVEYKTVTGIDIKTALGYIKKELGFSVNDIDSEEQAKKVQNLLSSMLNEARERGA